jgi:Co/Zn/Cd efflux system component
MIMSVGLIFSSLVIFLLGSPNGYLEDVNEWNAWHLFDPISTYIFGIVTILSTFPVLKNSYFLMMESTPSYIDLEALKKEFEEVEGVLDVHDIHVWDLKPSKTVAIAHVLAKKNTER